MLVLARVEQLDGDSDFIAGLPNAAFQQCSGSKFPADVREVLSCTLVLHRRGAGYDAETAHIRQGGYHLLGHAISEILIVRITRHVDERKNRDPVLVQLPVHNNSES